MRHPRFRLARAAFALSAVGVALSLVRGATAGDDMGLRRDTLQPLSNLPLSDAPATAGAGLPRLRRVWAAPPPRPLRITPARQARPGPAAVAHRGSLSTVPPFAEPQVVFPKLPVAPKLPRPALVSIYQDRTLRTGDAVMMADGIHVFHGAGAWPHRPGEFVRLTFAASLDWRLRQGLDALDLHPPTRWTAAAPAAG